MLDPAPGCCGWLPLKEKADPPNEVLPLGPPNMLAGWVDVGVFVPEPPPKLMVGTAVPALKEKGVALPAALSLFVLPKLNDEGVEVGMLNEV